MANGIIETSQMVGHRVGDIHEYIFFLRYLVVA